MNIDSLIKSGTILIILNKLNKLPLNQQPRTTFGEIVIIAFSQVSQYVY